MGLVAGSEMGHGGQCRRIRGAGGPEGHACQRWRSFSRGKRHQCVRLLVRKPQLQPCIEQGRVSRGHGVVIEVALINPMFGLGGVEIT